MIAVTAACGGDDPPPAVDETTPAVATPEPTADRSPTADRPPTGESRAAAAPPTPVLVDGRRVDLTSAEATLNAAYGIVGYPFDAEAEPVGERVARTRQAAQLDRKADAEQLLALHRAAATSYPEPAVDLIKLLAVDLARDDDAGRELEEALARFPRRPELLLLRDELPALHGTSGLDRVRASQKLLGKLSLVARVRSKAEVAARPQ